MFVNAGIMLKTCNLDFVLCDMPVWKHVYHMLHSCDQWFISPFEYEKEPDFHEPNLIRLIFRVKKRCQGGCSQIIWRLYGQKLYATSKR